jgi:hypothetical protein
MQFNNKFKQQQYRPNNFVLDGCELDERVELAIMKAWYDQWGQTYFENQGWSAMKSPKFSPWDYNLRRIKNGQRQNWFTFIECKVQNRFNQQNNTTPENDNLAAAEFLGLKRDDIQDISDEDYYNWTKGGKNYRITNHHNRPFFYLKMSKVKSLKEKTQKFNWEVFRNTDSKILIFYMNIPKNEIWVYKLDDNLSRFRKGNILLKENNQDYNAELKAESCLILDYDLVDHIFPLSVDMKEIQKRIKNGEQA